MSDPFDGFPPDDEVFAIEKGAAQKERDAWTEYDYDKDAEECAAAKHMCVVLPKYHQLQIDLDDDAAFEEHMRRYDQMCGDERSIFYRKHDYVELYSASGYPHRHITITFPDLSGSDFWEGFKEAERIGLQAALNDDPLRVYLNIRRLCNGIKNPTRFFEKPQLKWESRNGLIYIKGETDDQKFLQACAADAVANAYGFDYAERLVKWLEEHQQF